MYHTITNSTFERRVALLVIIAMLATSAIFAVYVRNVEAAALTNLSDTLSDSDLNVGANHTFSFGMPGGLGDGEAITITYYAGASSSFDVSSITFSDVDIASSSDYSVAADCTGAENFSFTNNGTDAFTFTACTGDGGDMVASTTVTIRIGTNAVVGASGTNQIVNPTSTGSYEINVATPNDSSDLRVAIIDDVNVTASVDTSLVFTIAGLATSTDVNGATTTYDTSGNATTLPFGILPLNTPVTLGQELTVQTNARNGFTVTVQQNNNLQSDTGADIDLFVDGDATSTPIAWQSPSNSISDENTWGHIGVTSEDSDLNGNEFGSQLFAGNFDTPRAVFNHTGPSDGTTPDIGLTQVAYRIEITALQEAADDYRNVLTYVATPVF